MYLCIFVSVYLCICCLAQNRPLISLYFISFLTCPCPCPCPVLFWYSGIYSGPPNYSTIISGTLDMQTYNGFLYIYVCLYPTYMCAYVLHHNVSASGGKWWWWWWLRSKAVRAHCSAGVQIFTFSVLFPVLPPLECPF